MPRIDVTPSHPMGCGRRIDEPSINAAAMTIELNNPHELAIDLLRLAGKVRRGEVVGGAHVVAALKAAAGFLNEDN